MDYCAKLKTFGSKTIAKADLETLFQTESEEALFCIVEALKSAGLLQPVKSSKTNGNNRYPIYLKHRITLPPEDYAVELSEISALHPLLQTTGYLQEKPDAYRKYRALIRKLDSYLFQRAGDIIPVSRKERSFQIFDEEKALEDRTFCALLEHLGLGAEALAYYDTPEFCFNDYIPTRKPEMTLLICENKDIWFNIRRMMFEDQRSSIFETQIDGVVYGCGNKVSQKDALSTYTRFMGGARVTYLYWGDIDRAGLEIYLNLCRGNPDVSISLFVPAYEKMLRLARERSIPDSEDGRIHSMDFTPVYAQLSEMGRQLMEQAITQNKRIPQEIISYALLKEIMR